MSKRERLARDDAEQAYIRLGELEVYRQLQRDAASLDSALEDGRAIAVGPFGRLRTEAVVDELGKTRGAINNLWGSQEAFRAAIMHLLFDDETLGRDEVTYPDPAASDSIDDWVAEWAAVEIERGPRHGMEPETRYGVRWAAWLGLVPYGIWSERVAGPSLDEYRLTVEHLAAAVLAPAFRHFGLTLATDVTVDDLAVAAAGAIEGAWLNAALTAGDPLGRPDTNVAALATTLRLLVRGATVAR